MRSASGYRSIVDHYEQCLARHGDCCLGVDWPNAADAERRYQVMLDVIRPGADRVSLLDFGCGASHLYEYLTRGRRTDIDYSGLDMSAKFVELSRRKFPSITYYNVDILGEDTLPAFDYVVMNGVLTEKRELPYAEMLAYAEALLERVFRHARVGLAFNVMSEYVDWKRDDLFHVPFDTLAAVLTARLSRHFVFRQDYGLYEYTAYVYR